MMPPSRSSAMPIQKLPSTRHAAPVAGGPAAGTRRLDRSAALGDEHPRAVPGHEVCAGAGERQRHRRYALIHRPAVLAHEVGRHRAGRGLPQHATCGLFERDELALRASWIHPATLPSAVRAGIEAQSAPGSTTGGGSRAGTDQVSTTGPLQVGFAVALSKHQRNHYCPGRIEDAAADQQVARASLHGRDHSGDARARGAAANAAQIGGAFRHVRAVRSSPSGTQMSVRSGRDRARAVYLGAAVHVRSDRRRRRPGGARGEVLLHVRSARPSPARADLGGTFRPFGQINDRAPGTYLGEGLDLRPDHAPPRVRPRPHHMSFADISASDRRSSRAGPHHLSFRTCSPARSSGRAREPLDQHAPLGAHGRSAEELDHVVEAGQRQLEHRTPARSRRSCPSATGSAAQG